MRDKPLSTYIGPLFAWVSALLVVAACSLIVIYPLLKGAHMLSFKFLFTEPLPDLQESLSGGILTPIAGTILIIVLGIAVTIPLALGTAIYMAEYMSEDSWVTKLMRLGVDVLAGVPSIVFAIFGLAVFGLPQLAFLSSKVEGNDIANAFGRSFIVGALVMAVHILPFVTKVMEESIKTVPEKHRLAAYALGTTRWRSIRKVILPSAMPGIITAMVLGMGLIAGDTAIVWLCVGGSMTMTGAEHWWLPAHWLETIKHSGSTLTTYIYYASPAGEGDSPNKAFGAAFILVLIVLTLNLGIDYVARFRKVKENGR